MAVLKEMNDLDAGREEFLKSLAQRKMWPNSVGHATVGYCDEFYIEFCTEMWMRLFVLKDEDFCNSR
jgi:hypothetical protein